MVKNQRRMTMKKNNKKSTGLAKRSVRGPVTKSTKVKKTSGAKRTTSAKTDRANQAMKTLLKALKNQTEE